MAVTAEQLIKARIPGTGRLIQGGVEEGEVLVLTPRKARVFVA